MRGTTELEMAGAGVQCWLQDLSSDLRLEEVLDRTIENALRACPDREFALWISDQAELTLVRTSGLDPGSRQRLDDWLRTRGSAFGEPLEIEDRRLIGWPLRSLPLAFKGRPVGALLALAPSGELFDEDECELLDAFAEQAAVAISNAQLFQALLESASQDALTELPNRREFDRLLRRELDRSRRYGTIFSLAILDLDEFKELNDSRGHDAGDAVLRQAADLIQRTCRASDIPSRLGGDEFALLLPATNQFQGAALCERLRKQVEDIANVSLSWGVAEYPTHGDTAATLTRVADAAMYVSKPRVVGGERAVPLPPRSRTDA
jgi:diguanylate cyclase (GGDEF)-like protein